MKIDDSQINILNQFSCQRLSKVAEMMDIGELYSQFENSRGALLVNYLRQKGLQQDKLGEIAFYIILSPTLKPCLFFSLQCGSLFDVPFNHKLHLKILEQYKTLPEDKKGKIGNILQSLKKRVKIFNKEQKKEVGQRIFRVNNIYSSVELVHFCANDNARDEWKKLKIKHPMGEVLFWYYISPLIIKLQEIVGCKYVHLFAADNTDDEVLINYYKQSLKFKRESELGTVKPFYDFTCAFMSQDILTLNNCMNTYFNEFNYDKKEDFV